MLYSLKLLLSNLHLLIARTLAEGKWSRFLVLLINVVILTLVMAGLLLPVGSKKSRLPIGSIVTFTAMAAGTAVLILDPFHSADMPVYILTLAIMAGVVWECINLLHLYNKSCSNELPQFASHNGGEDL